MRRLNFASRIFIGIFVHGTGNNGVNDFESPAEASA
jgi:hypothetical protein